MMAPVSRLRRMPDPPGGQIGNGWNAVDPGRGHLEGRARQKAAGPNTPERAPAQRNHRDGVRGRSRCRLLACPRRGRRGGPFYAISGHVAPAPASTQAVATLKRTLDGLVRPA